MDNHHKINYIEFPTTNMEATQSFFTGVFGWEFKDYGPDYSSFLKAGIDGGFFRSEEKRTDTSEKTLVVLYCRDLGETKSKIAEAGGRIVKDIYSFPGGRRFHFIEPGGNELAVWSDVE